MYYRIQSRRKWICCRSQCNELDPDQEESDHSVWGGRFFTPHATPTSTPYCKCEEMESYIKDEHRRKELMLLNVDISMVSVAETEADERRRKQ